MILHTNKWCLLISDQVCKYLLGQLENSQCFGVLARPFHFLLNTPFMKKWILTGPARVEWLWVNGFSHNEYHIWQAWLSTYWHVGNKFPKYEVPVFIAQTLNHRQKWKYHARVPKNGLSNCCDYILCQCILWKSNKKHRSCVMYVALYAICVWNWNWWLTQDHFLIKHWNQCTHRCSAPVVGLEGYSLGLVSRYSTVRSGTLI